MVWTTVLGVGLMPIQGEDGKPNATTGFHDWDYTDSLEQRVSNLEETVSLLNISDRELKAHVLSVKTEQSQQAVEDRVQETII